MGQVDEAIGEALARRVEEMVAELHEEEAGAAKEPPEGQEVSGSRYGIPHCLQENHPTAVSTVLVWYFSVAGKGAGLTLHPRSSTS